MKNTKNCTKQTDNQETTEKPASCFDCGKELPPEIDTPDKISWDVGFSYLVTPDSLSVAKICNACTTKRHQEKTKTKQEAISKLKNVVFAPESLDERLFVAEVAGKLVLGLSRFGELDEFSFVEISRDFYDAFVKEFASAQNDSEDRL